jgi:RNA polymerase sigma factor (sigma-70 family)
MMTATLELESLRRMVSDAQGGNRDAADKIVRAHEPWLRSVIYGVTGRPDLVDDVMQQVWTQAWERLGSLQDPQRLRPWLYSIARHAAIDAGVARKRRESRTATLEIAGEVARETASSNPADVAMKGELSAVLLRAVESLPAIYREPFALRHLENWTYAEIGDMLGLPVETVETRLVRARRLLREMLTGKIDTVEN